MAMKLRRINGRTQEAMLMRVSREFLVLHELLLFPHGARQRSMKSLRGLFGHGKFRAKMR